MVQPPASSTARAAFNALYGLPDCRCRVFALSSSALEDVKERVPGLGPQFVVLPAQQRHETEHAALEAGRRAGDRKPAVHRVEAKTCNVIVWFRCRRGLQTADHGCVAPGQTANVRPFAGRVRLRAADGYHDVIVSIGLRHHPARSRNLAA